MNYVDYNDVRNCKTAVWAIYHSLYPTDSVEAGEGASDVTRLGRNRINTLNSAI